MRTSRRGFLGFMGGAVAAGPKLATELASAAPQPTPSMGYLHGGIGASNDGDWKARQVAKLRGLLAGRDPQPARDRKLRRLYSIEQQERFRLDALRSVSPVHRYRMFIDGDMERQDRINAIHWERELNDLLGLDA